MSLLRSLAVVAVVTAVAAVPVTPAGSQERRGRAQAAVAIEASVTVVVGQDRSCGGTLWGEDLVLTAYHCLRQGVQFHEVRARLIATRGEVVWSRRGADVALLRTWDRVLGRVPVVAADVVAGDEVLLVGSPAGYELFLTRGWVAGVRQRSFGRDDSTHAAGFDSHQVVHVAAMAWHGSSGGGVFDEAGNLVGVLVRAEFRPVHPSSQNGSMQLLWALAVGPDELRAIPRAP